MNKTLAFVALASILGLVAYAVTGMVVMKAYGETSKERFVIFLGYSDEEVIMWQSLYDRTFTDLPSEFAPMLKGEDVQLIPAPHMKDLLTVYNVILPEMRKMYPTADFIFVVKPKAERDYRLVTSMMYGGSSDVWKADAATSIDKGIAFVMEQENGGTINSIQHEMMHLVDCGTWHDSDGRTLPNGEIRKYPEADSLPWCV